MPSTEQALIWVADNVFGQVAILIGLITLLGLALQRKPLEEVVGGTLRAALGVVILFVGVDLFTGGLSAVQHVVSSAVGVAPPAAQSSLDDFLAAHGGTVALTTTVGFLLHVALVRAFRAARYVYLTGHLMFWVSALVTACLVEAYGEGLPQLTLVLAGSVVAACYWTLQPLWTRPLMRRLTGKDDFGLGHTTSTLALLTAVVARPFGDPGRHGTERLAPPRRLAFLTDVNVGTALVIGAVLLAAMAFADPRVLAGIVAEYNAAEGANVGVWSWGVLAALRFAAGIAVLLFGVRMFLAEIVPAFKGIGDTAAPGTRPALDVPTVFPFAPTAVMIGFAASTASFLALLVVFAATGWFTLVPPMIMLFFGGGAGGVFGNAVAGWRGAVIGGALNGVLLAAGQALTWGMLGSTAPELATLADADWYVIAWLLLGVGRVLPSVWAAPALAAAVTVAVLAWPALRARRARRARRRTAAGPRRPAGERPRQPHSPDPSPTPAPEEPPP
ncbi:PTS transporter subunit IIC [Nocardiopsis sediminis]|uniref:Ascorbate-specific PTS system EIIC component n=1 Tax=Nocardiopsis sediminis TaxID=1778267 RepID=A0ABV8FLI6_9ACTN